MDRERCDGAHTHPLRRKEWATQNRKGWERVKSDETPKWGGPLLAALSQGAGADTT